MAEFEVVVAGWIRVTKRFRVWDAADGDEAGARAVTAVKAQQGPWRGFKVDPRSDARNVEVARVTPANLASAQADSDARAEKQAKRPACAKPGLRSGEGRGG